MIITTVYWNIEIIREQWSYYKELKRWKTKINMSLAICHCGNEFLWRTSDIIRWKVLSCWCSMKKRKYFYKIPALKHWMCWKKIYNVYRWIKQRCNDENHLQYKDWGGRGIKCEWNSFDEFYKDMWELYQEWLSIDRIDNNLNYCKSNCRWANKFEQANNKRNTNYIKYKWIVKSLPDWCRELWISYNKTRQRIFILWWEIEKSFTTI